MPKSPKPASFRANDYVVYPAHGVGRITSIEEQEIAGAKAKAKSSGMRPLSDKNTLTKALDTLKGRARVKRVMWSRRAQEYEAKINSGDIVSIAEVVRDLHRAEDQPEQSYSERQLYEAAFERLAREVAVVEKIKETDAADRLSGVLVKRAA